MFPNLAGLNKARADLVAILLTGIPSGIVAGFQNYTGPVAADQLRLNMAIPPTSSPNRFGLLGGDLAGFPNGRRVSDDIVAIELRAVAGVTYPLIDKSYTPDAAAGLLEQFADLAARRGSRTQPLPVDVPVPGDAGGRLRHPGELTTFTRQLAGRRGAAPGDLTLIVRSRCIQRDTPAASTPSSSCSTSARRSGR